MKHAPIVNPHARIGQIVKKTKAEERDDLIDMTKTQVKNKYGGSRKITKKTYQMGATGQEGMGDDDKGGVQLDEKVDKQSVSIKLLEEGYPQAYIDFFYLTAGTTPSSLQPSERLIEEQKLNKQMKQAMPQDPDHLTHVMQMLSGGERAVRDGNAKECFQTYRDMARMFEGYNDYETASYFHNRCLNTSIEFNYIEGEARAHQGLGNAEENVFNKFEAKNHLETALEKAKEGGLNAVVKDISNDLVRVYQQIANEYLDIIKSRQQGNDQGEPSEREGLFELSAKFFNKCLEVSLQQDLKKKIAECYQQLGLIHEMKGNLVMAIEEREKFLDITKEQNDAVAQSEAHKLLAETYSKDNNISKAIQHLN